MTKICPVCQKPIQDGEIVVALLMARFKTHDEGYQLEAMAQTISSHVFCVEVPKSEQK